MHGAILLAVFAFCVVLALAIAARRPLLASAALIAGAGWPATVLDGQGRARARRDHPGGHAAALRRDALAADARPAPAAARRRGDRARGRDRVRRRPSVARGEFVDGWRSWDVPHGRRRVRRRRVRLELELRRDPVPEEADDGPLDRRGRAGGRVLARHDARLLHQGPLGRAALRGHRAGDRRRPPGSVRRPVPSRRGGGPGHLAPGRRRTSKGSATPT